MPFTPSQSGSGSATANCPIAKGFGGLILLALAGLIVLRFAFGSVRAEVGIR